MGVTQQIKDGKIVITGTSQSDIVVISHKDPITGRSLNGEFNVSIYTFDIDFPNPYDNIGKIPAYSQNFKNSDSSRLVIRAANGNDAIRNDTRLSGFVFEGNAGRDRITGGRGSESIRGGPGNDTLTGNGGNDEIHGEGDNDELWGNSGLQSPFRWGTTTLTGGDGADTFVIDDSNDQVNDFQRGDRVLGGGAVKPEPGVDDPQQNAIQEQLSTLQKGIPAVMQAPLDFLDSLYQKILNNPNIQQAAQQLEQWTQRFQKVAEQIPEPVRDALIGALPFPNLTQALQAKQAWDALPSWAQDTLISFAPFGDGVDLVKQTYNAAVGNKVDPVVVTLSTIGLAGDLGWLDGILPDPADGVNAGAALLKAAYKRMGSPAREAMTALIQRVGKNADELAQFTKRLGDLLPNVKVLMQHPDALPRLFNLSDAAFKQAMDNPKALQEAIRRAEFADNFIGKKLTDLTPAQRQTLEQAYNVNKNGVIKRNSVDEGYTQLTVTDGVIKEGAGKVSDRLSNPTQMKKNYNAVYGAVPKGNQVHHLLPDSVVRDHSLAQLARKAGYNLDESSNLFALPYTKEALQKAKVKIIHLGSHPNWSKYVRERLEISKTRLEVQFGKNNIPPDAAKSALQSLEKELRDLLTGDVAQLRKLGIVEDYSHKGLKGIRISQIPTHKSPNKLETPTTVTSAIVNSEIRANQAPSLPNEEAIDKYTAHFFELMHDHSSSPTQESVLYAVEVMAQTSEISSDTVELLAETAFEHLEQPQITDQIVQG